MTWSLWRFRTVDGLIIGQLPDVDFSWSRSVRDGSMDAPHKGVGKQAQSSIDFPLDALFDAGVVSVKDGWQSRLAEALMPTKYGIAALYNGVPIVAGVIADSVSVEPDKVSLTVGGITDVLARRYVVPEDFSARASLTWSALSLGTIAKRVVQQAMAKPSGGLPITFEPDEAAANDDGHRRTYKGFNVANLSAASVLEKIANIGEDSVGGSYGPDIDFRPYLRDSQHIAWHMHTGTEHDPYIGQKTVHDWEQGSDGVEDLTAKLSTEFMAHRVYGVGNGTDEGTRVGRVTGAIPELWPLLETVVNDSQWENDDLMNRHMRAALSTSPLMQVTLTVRADGPTPLGQFWPGDVCNLTTHGFPTLPDGTHRMRIQQMSGANSETVTLTLDPIPLNL